jgi:AcrR family transcriptional regulator
VVEVARVPQGERSRATRARLMEATISCLVERGWTGTSTTLVSHRAGVSRGAQLHHFPTKNDLVLAAIDHLTTLRAEELTQDEKLPGAGVGRTRHVLDQLVELFTGHTFRAALELWVAARTDPGLRDAVTGLEARLGRDAHRRTVEALGIDETVPGNRELVQATLDLMRGLGLANTLSDDAARRRRILDRWAQVLDAELVRTPGGTR